VIPLAVPLPPPGRAVAVLFLGVDGMAQPVIDIGIRAVAQDDPLAPQDGQRRQGQPIQHGTQAYAPMVTVPGRRSAAGLRCEDRWEAPVRPEPGAQAAAAGPRADRERVIDLLKAAFVQGRLTKDELDARAGQAFTARTYAELAALTADIPAGSSTRPPRQPARPQNRTAQDRTARTHPVRNAAIGSVSCLTVGFLAFWYGASLDDHTTLVFLSVTLLALVAATGIMGYGIFGAVTARRSRRQLPPRPGQDGQAPEGQRRGSTGDDPSRPGPRTGQTRADLRAHRSRSDRPHPCRRPVPAPRGARPAPGAA